MVIKRFALSVLLFSLIFINCGCNKKQSGENIYHSKIINIDKINREPNKYNGFQGVKGIVIKVDESKNIFLLGCEDACIFMPVQYSGQMPKLRSEIIVYGELIKHEDGRYIFHGKEVKTK